MARAYRSLYYGYRKYIEVVHLKKILILLVIINASIAESNKNETDEDITRLGDDIPTKLKLLQVSSKKIVGDVYQNGTFRTGNSLWDNILNQCTFKPSISCLQKNFYSYLDKKLDYNDVNITSGVCFKKNNVDINKYSKEANIIYLTGSKRDDHDRALDEENEIQDDEGSETPLEEVTDALYGKGINFLMTHDLKLALPEMLFDGATLKLSPRALTKTGALVHIEMQPKKEENGEGRIFFNKIKKYLRRKLVMAALAVILVIKLIALKVVFVLPLILGVTTAKKMFLKLLLFLFPALSHIFKLCSWYHQNYHTTKFHHHHHLITHHHKAPHSHHGPPPPVYGPPPHAPHGPHGPHGPHIPHGQAFIKHQDVNQPSFEHYPQDWELSGPGLGPEYISDIHRNAIASFKPHENDVNDINAWGLALPPGQSQNVGEYAASGTSGNGIPTANAANKISPINTGRPQGPPHPYYRNKKYNAHDPTLAEKEALIRAASLAARAPPSPVRDEILRVSAAKLTESNRVKVETDLVKHQQEILAAQDPDTIAAENFYSVLIEKVDAILSSVGVSEVGCRERAICALYKDPFKHAPYSNLVSNELSKDSSELVPPADSKMALRYYKYVTAAREGQENRDCHVLYPNCNIEYNK